MLTSLQNLYMHLMVHLSKQVLCSTSEQQQP